jgi:hypothetical protein
MPILGANSPEQFRLLEFINTEGFKKGPEWEIASIDYLAEYIRDLERYIRNLADIEDIFTIKDIFGNLCCTRILRFVQKNIEINKSILKTSLILI